MTIRVLLGKRAIISLVLGTLEGGAISFRYEKSGWPGVQFVLRDTRDCLSGKMERDKLITRAAEFFHVDGKRLDRR